MKNRLVELEDQFQLLDSNDQHKIKAGTGIPISDEDLQRMFNYNSLGGFNSDLAKIFNKEVGLLAFTDMGSSVLQELLTASKVNSANQINLTTNNVIPGAVAHYDWSSVKGSSIDIGNLSSYKIDDATDIQAAFHPISHELFHAYESIVKNKRTNDISAELDANLFAAFSEKQLEITYGKDTFYFMGANIYIGYDQSTPQEASFQQSWNTIIYNGGFDLYHYNELIDNFKFSKFNRSSIGSGYNNLEVKEATDLENNSVDIYNLFKQHYVPENSIQYGGSGTTNESYDGNPNSNDFYNPFNNPLFYYIITQPGDSGSSGSQDWGEDGISTKTGLPWYYHDLYQSY